MKKLFLPCLLIAIILISFGLVSFSEYQPSQQGNAKKSTVWIYKEKEDKMTDAKNYYAMCPATEKVKLGAPFDEEITVYLVIAFINGTDYHLGISLTGGAMDASPTPSTIRIRFDKNPPDTCGIRLFDEDTKDQALLTPAKDLIAKIKKSSKLIIEVPFKYDGKRQIEFDTHGLVWNH